MTEAITDPYSDFLGLPPGLRPPHFYDLLQVELFCSQHERIHQAVRKQFRLIKRYHDHHDRQVREAVQDIMNAIATSRVVLTDPVKKDEYDLELAAKLGIDREDYLRAQVASPLPEFEITVIAGPTQVEHRFELIEGTPFTIGTDRGCSVSLNRGRSVAKHAVIEFVDGEWLLKSISREAHVRVGDMKIEEYALAHGDTFDLGGYRMHYGAIARRDEWRSKANVVPPPLSLILQKGPSIPAAIFNVLAPQRITIGHGESALWQLPDQTVSRLHCAVQSVGDRWEIEDLDSTNSTKINGQDVMRRLLADRDVITLGNFEITVSLRF